MSFPGPNTSFHSVKIDTSLEVNLRLSFAEVRKAVRVARFTQQ